VVGAHPGSSPAVAAAQPFPATLTAVREREHRSAGMFTWGSAAQKLVRSPTPTGHEGTRLLVNWR
jgi:hypothetical protein